MANDIAQGNDESILWIGTTFGLNKFEIDKANVTRYPQAGGVYSLLADSKGNLWIGRSYGDVSKLVLKNGRIEDYWITRIDAFQSGIFSMIEMPANSGVVWIRNGYGVKKYNPDKNSFSHIYIDPYNKLGKIKDYYRTLTGCKDSLLVLGCAGGLMLLNINTGKYKVYQLPVAAGKNTTIIALALSKTDDNAVWVGTSGGIYKFDIEKRVFLDTDITGQKAFFKEPVSILSMCEDHSGVLWIATSRQGVFKFIPSGYDFNRQKKLLESLKISTSLPVWSIFKSSKDYLWIGTNNGLYLADSKNRIVKKYIHDPDNKESITGRPIRTIIKDKNSNGKKLWIGFQEGGLSHFDIENGKFHNYSFLNLSMKTTGSNNIYAVLQDDEGHLWIGSNGGGLDKFDPKTEKMIHYDYDKNSPFQWITFMIERGKNEIWLGTFSDGLFSFDKEKLKFTEHSLLTKNGQKASSILSLCFDKNGYLWVGSYENGLFKYDIKSGKSVNYTTENGLPANLIYTVLEDSLGFIWMSTDKGLSRYNPVSNTFVNYTPKEGLQGLDYNMGVSFKSSEGELFFGGNKGFNSFLPGCVLSPAPPKTQITYLKKNGVLVPFDTPLNQLKEISLNYFENSFSIGFTGLHFKDPARNQYRYMLEGYSSGWIYTTDLREANYYNVSPGEYNFVVQSANCDGLWDANGKRIKIVLNEAFWRTAWFNILAVILIAALVYSVTKFRINSKLKLEMARFDERKKIRNKIARDFHDELGHTATQISAMAAVLKKECSTDPAKINMRLDKIAENAKLLFDEMKEFNWELDPEKDSLYYIIVSLKNFSDTLFDNTETAFELKGNLKECEIIIIPLEIRQHIMRIFKEGMHNILKHAKGCKNVILSVEVNKNVLEMTLTDDGCGFIQSGDFTGCGLKNMQKRAEEIKGKIEIDSKINSGTKLIFNIKLA